MGLFIACHNDLTELGGAKISNHPPVPGSLAEDSSDFKVPIMPGQKSATCKMIESFISST